MGRDNIVLWIFEIIVAWAIIFIMQIPLRKSKRTFIKAIVFVVKLVLIVITAGLFFTINSKFTYRHGDILNGVYIVLVADAAADIVEFLIRFIKQHLDSTKEQKNCLLALIGILSAVFCVSYFVYGFMNATHVHMKQHTWKAEGISGSHTFAFASDLHADSAISMDLLREFCRQVNEADPEFVILGGDVTDELTSYDEMIEAYQILSEIRAPKYFIYGNHDRQPDSDFVYGPGYDESQLTETIRDAGIVILSDEYVKVDDDLILLGREDMTMKDKRVAWSSLVNPYEGEGALIVADHQPHDKEQLAGLKSALQLSGHVHAGQLWPLQTFCRLQGVPAYGEYQEPATLLYVSSGESGWMMPFRSEAHCEWELITLE